MKEIDNIEALKSILDLEAQDWQKDIFHRLGVVVVPGPGEKYPWSLISACGYSDLDADVDSSEGTISIYSASELIRYINDMPTYQKALRDIKIGTFSKSELF